jgi:hypothetical protein
MGVNNDNRWNLKVLCPNCNASLDLFTHCGNVKNKKNIKIPKKLPLRF